MSRQATSFVLGYHGCDKAVGEKALGGQIRLLQSKRKYDWLGPGTYFWESDAKRAWEFAEWRVDRGDYDEAFVVGAVIDLRHCLDLTSREDLEILRAAHDSFIAVQKKSGLEIPANKNDGFDPNRDRRLRYLDCAVITHLHSIVAEADPYDTVRCMFTEGGELYPGAAFRELSHVQIAVLTDSCIRGIFRPR